MRVIRNVETAGVRRPFQIHSDVSTKDFEDFFFSKSSSPCPQSYPGVDGSDKDRVPRRRSGWEQDWTRKRPWSMRLAIHCATMCAAAVAVSRMVGLERATVVSVPLASAFGILVAPYVKSTLPRTSLPKAIMARLPVTPNYHIILLELGLLSYFANFATQDTNRPMLESNATGISLALRVLWSRLENVRQNGLMPAVHLDIPYLPKDFVFYYAGSQTYRYAIAMAAVSFLAAVNSRRSRIVFLWVVFEHLTWIPSLLSYFHGASKSLAPLLPLLEHSFSPTTSAVVFPVNDLWTGLHSYMREAVIQRLAFAGLQLLVAVAWLMKAATLVSLLLQLGEKGRRNRSGDS
uniref:Transmembrane protein n=1 Tax=Neospora caninum (strain Liverpool) TaxID=572307 RepID=A0A0F7UA05_NEOCL|nr:TPA: hypothetical protein BN1204_016780 [Neospora caninum Liverpool]